MKDHKTNKLLEEIIRDEDVFLSYLKSRFPLFHKSNFFFRDMEYGVKSYLEKKNTNISSSENLKLSVMLSTHFENKGFFKKISDGVWMINIPEYITSKPGDPF